MRMPDADETPELSRVRSSDFFGCEPVLGAEVGGGEAGMEKPTTVDLGRLDEPGVRRREAHDFWAGFGVGAGVGTGVDVEASAVDVDGAGASAAEVDGAGASAVDVDGTGSSTEAGCETSGSAEIEGDGSVNGSFGSGAEVEVEISDPVIEEISSACSGALGREKEVLVETGEPGTGVSGAVDSAGVVVDSVPSGWSDGVGTDVLI